MNIYPVINKSQSHVSIKRQSYITRQSCFSLLSNQYISNISNIYNPDVNLRLASKTICDQMLSDPNSDNIFQIFGYIPELYIFPSSYVAISHFLRRRWWSILWVDYRLNQIYLIKNIIYCPIQNGNTEPNWKYYLENYLKNSIE